jgi:LysM repeat protein
MSRRDTIIIAVLVNAGLLMVLFATATKSKLPKADVQNQLVQELPIVEKKPVKEVAATTLDKFLFASEEALTAEVSFEEEDLYPIHAIEEPANYVVVTVKQGDALDKIARANNTTIAQIMQLNALSSTQLQLGQRLKVPVGATVAVQQTQPATSVHPQDIYIVKDGDNPWLIASKNHVKLEELLRLNNLDDKKAKKLRPGDRLRIR